ncbi:uncharacterized protein [Clytia hemisphaerica]|uniref:Ion transport domain-containing protein n=1 Tax=Clytia hemisphaerica TaxID=252671 RepID=A0A7M5UX27_9CNID|eukprot:TCONS_00072872-protein
MGWPSKAVIKWWAFFHMVTFILIKDIQSISECQFYYWEVNQTLHNGGTSFGQNQCNRRSGGAEDTNFPRFEISWIPAPPYLIDDEGSDTPKGFFFDMIEDWIKTSCTNSHLSWKPTSIRWRKRPQDSVKDLVEWCRDNVYDCSMSVPAVGVSKKNGGNGIVYHEPFAALYKVPDVVYVTVEGETWRNAIDSFSQSVINLWPFIMLCLLCAFISGAIIWFLDTWTNDQDFPRAFFSGTYHGFWWSFVSMTTVGYGDKAPVSIVARSFSVIWIIIGILMICILTSLMSNGLSAAIYVPEKVVVKAKVGVLPGIETGDIIVNELDGEVKMLKDIIELENWLARGLLTGFVMDMYTFQHHYEERLSKLNVKYVVERRFPMEDYHYGIAFHHMDRRNPRLASKETWRTCLEDYIEYNYHFKEKMERHYRQSVLANLDPALLKPSESPPLDLFDINSGFFQTILYYVLGTAATILVIGLIYEFFRLVFFGENGIDFSQKLGLAHNAGYTADGESAEQAKTDSPNKKMTREERQMAELVEQSIQRTEDKMQGVERDVKNEIREMVRSIRRQIHEMKRKQDKDYGL